MRMTRVVPMNCLEFRRLIGAQPDSAAPELTAHAAQCPACARHQQELQRIDKLIHRALDIDIDETAVSAGPAHTRRSIKWGLAASVLIAVLTASLWLAYPRETLAERVVEHVRREPQALVATSEVSSAKLASILGHSGMRMKSGAGPVSYASSCPFRGHTVPHLVVQTDTGPVTVLVLPQEESISEPETFNEGGYQGLLLPAPRGALAVIGPAASLKDVAAEVLASIEYVR